jgi:DNA-binding NarL/FixJ family response regulator
VENAEAPFARTKPSRIIIADDHPLFLVALKQLLNGRSDLEVVAEAQDGREALELCRRLLPDLVLMDIRMPRMDGLAATSAIKREFPHIIVLVITGSEDTNLLTEALRVGASGYVIKDATPQRMIDAIRRVLRGESPLNQEIAMRLLMKLIDEEQNRETVNLAHSERHPEEGPSSALLESLTPREAEVLQLIARGQTNHEIARNLLISVSTVKKHVQHVIAKLEVSDRTQAAIRAIELGLLREGLAS